MQPISREPVTSALLHLFALFGFAVGAPTFGLLRDNPEFLIAHGVGGGDLALLVAAITLGPPIAARLLERAIGLAVPELARALHLALVASLVCLTSLPPILHAFPDAGNAAVILPALAAGGAGALLYARFAVVRRGVGVAAVGPLLFAAMFWLDDSTAKVRTAGVDGAASTYSPITTSAPIVWIVLDELPIASLLDANREIDAARFPNFAAIARSATWFRDTAAVAEETAMAVPPIVTGRYPETDRLPVASDHPDNLFSLLAPSYAMNVVETRTMLHGRTPVAGRSKGPHLADFYTDLAVLYAHVVSPPAVVERLPTIADDWKGFGEPTEAELEKIQVRDYSSRLAEFERFRSGITACEARCLHFVHVVLPHVPWQFLPSGGRYFPASSYGIHREDGRWVDDPWWASEGHKRHLLQLAFVDALLGRVLADLRHNDLFERSLLVLVADHGASFWPGQTRRLLEGHSHPGDVLRVPFFVKAPFQTEGKVVDARIATIDILPTALALLDVAVPWETDGRPALAPEFSGRERRIAFDMEGGRHEFVGNALDVAASLARKLDTFGADSGAPGLFAAGRHGALVGRRTSEFEIRPTGGLRLEIASEPFDVLKKWPDMTPGRSSGRFTIPNMTRGEHHVAIGVGGTIHVVAPTYRLALTQRAFSVVVPEIVAAHGPEALEFHLVTGPPDQPVLQPAAAEFVPIQGELDQALKRDPDSLSR